MVCSKDVAKYKEDSAHYFNKKEQGTLDPQFSSSVTSSDKSLDMFFSK
jgi:hypothetical protein